MSSVLWLSWKDHKHPGSGGAEVVLMEISKRLVRDGHKVTILTAEYEGALKHEIIDGIEFIRIGTNRYLHSFQALAHYIRRLRGKYDVVVEAVNTAPYFAPLFGGKNSLGGAANFFLFYHQLAREIWRYETAFPLSILGHRVLEPGASFLLSKSRANVITVSNSTKQDLVKSGFKPERIEIISEGIEMEPAKSLDGIKKYDRPTILSLGAMRAMKQTMHQVKAFETAKLKVPSLQLKIVGSSDSDYGRDVLNYIKQSKHAADIEYLGRVPYAQKIEVMQKAHVVAVTSIKEGWCLVVTEANSQGTPAVAYNADGLRDSIQHGKTGYLTTSNTPTALADKIVDVLGDSQTYDALRRNAWEWSKSITFDTCYLDFKRVVKL